MSTDKTTPYSSAATKPLRPKLTRFFINYRIAGTGNTGVVHFSKASKEEAKLAAFELVRFYAERFELYLEAVELYVRTTGLETGSHGWYPVSLAPATQHEILAELKAIAELDSCKQDKGGRPRG